MIKWTTVAACAVLLCTSVARASVQVSSDDASVDDAGAPTARFAFVNLNPDGSLSFTFNTTSLQYALLAALTGLVLAAILLPLLGLIGIGREEPDFGFAFADQKGYTGTTYDAAASNTYTSYGKRYPLPSLLITCTFNYCC